MDDSIYCSYCGEEACLIRHVDVPGQFIMVHGKREQKRRKEHLCNGCIDKEMKGELKIQMVGVDNI